MKRFRWIKIVCILLLLCVCYRVLAPAVISGSRGTDASGHSVEDSVSDTPEGVAEDSVEDQDKGEETIVGWVIDKIAAGDVELSDEESVRNAISQGESELGISLTEETKDRIVGFAGTLDSIEVGAEDFMEQATEKYRTYSTQFVEKTNEAINEAVGGAVESASESFFESLKQSAVDFFKDLKP